MLFETPGFEITDFLYWFTSRFGKDSLRPYPYNEMHLMVSALLWSKPDFVYEWGTNEGKSARLFYEACKYFRLPTKIVTCDLPDNVEHIEHPKDILGRHIKGLDILQLRGDGVKECMRHYKEHYRPYSKYLWFLDGDHSAQSVLRELEDIDENVAHPIVLIHDTFFQHQEAQYNIGPWLAVREFLSFERKYKILETETGTPGITLLYRE